MKLVFHLHGIVRRYNKRGRRDSEWVHYIIIDDGYSKKQYNSIMRMTIYSQILKKL